MEEIFLSIILMTFIASIITAYLNYENNKNILSIEFHIEKERFLKTDYFKIWTYSNLNIEDISKYIKICCTAKYFNCRRCNKIPIQF